MEEKKKKATLEIFKFFRKLIKLAEILPFMEIQ